jgi:succinate-semialdehyde dehydrogenase / glutarate-semialdehyde dehydrogenase
MITTTNPATGQPLAHYPLMTTAEMRKAIGAADRAFQRWRRTPFLERAERLRALAAILRERGGMLAELMAGEMGKPVTAGRAEIEKCAWVCEFYAEHGEAFLADEVIETDASRSYATCQPLGVVLAVMPWNFPFWQVFRFAAPDRDGGQRGGPQACQQRPGLCAGHPGIVSGRGFPGDVFVTLLVDSAARSRRASASPRSRRDAHGQQPAGRAVARSWRAPQEDGTRAGRQRSVRDPGGRGPGGWQRMPAPPPA